MTSTTSNQSDSGCPDKNDPKDQAECPELQIQPSFATNGIAHPGISSPNVHFPTTPQLVATHAMAPATYPYPDPYYRSIFAPYDAQPYATHPFGAQPMVHLQLMGIQQAGIPLPSDAVEEPVFVNAKQYHGILRRRQSRAKAESEKKVIKSKKPYLHESRHLHALRRARGDGGRFLNSKKSENEQKEAASSDKSQSNLNVNFDRNDNASSNGKS